MLEILLGLFTFTANTILGFLVYYRNTKNWTNRLFLLLTYSINVYLITNYLSLHPPVETAANQLFWIRVVMCVCSFIGPILLLFVHTFPHDKIVMSRKKLLALLVLCLTSASAALSPFLFTRLDFVNGQPVPQPGPAIPIFFVDFVGLFVVSIILLVIKYRKAKGIEKEQHLYFLFGVIFTFSLMAITTVMFVVILKFSGLVFLGPNVILFLIAFLAYAIIKHRFLDLHFLVARAVVFSILMLIVGCFYSLLLVYVGGALFKRSLSIEEMLYYALLTLTVTLTFVPLRKGIAKVTDRFFYKSTQQPETILKDLSQVTNTSIDINSLANNILDTLLKELRITRGALIVLSQESEKKASFIFQRGYDKPIDITDSDIEFFLESPTTLVFDEMLESPKRDLLRHFRVAISLPLISNNVQIGLALLGEKSSGNIYTDEEINLLEIFAPEAAIAMQNALSYEEIIQFNSKLQKEVEKATTDMKAIAEDMYKKNSELNRVSTQLAEANTKLKDLDHLKDEFVSLASHELRTPMTAIKSYLWMFLQYNATELDPKERQYIERAYEATDRLITLVNDMLNVSRIESGRMNILFMPVDLLKLVKEVTEELNPTAIKQNVAFAIDSMENLPPVSGDQNKIREVITNLVGNSLKFTPPGGTITIKMTKDNEMVVVDVIDTGKGIEKDDLAKLFQKFGTVGNNYLTKTNTQGTGLGLYISKSIVELHGGRIWVKSEGENKGTTFSFTLKIANTAVSPTS